MRVLCAILIAVVVLHVQCGATCFANAIVIELTRNEPPCHKHSEEPRESKAGCEQSSAAEAKLTSVARDAARLAMTSEAPAVVLAPPTVESFLSELIYASAPPQSPPSIVPILRI